MCNFVETFLITHLMKTSTTSPARSRMPISVKAYNTFIYRINTLFGPTREAARMTEAVDLYLQGTPFDMLPLHDTPSLAMAFNMLRQEIDRAMTRSLKARQRAAARKAKTTAQANLHCTKSNATERLSPEPQRPGQTTTDTRKSNQDFKHKAIGTSAKAIRIGTAAPPLTPEERERRRRMVIESFRKLGVPESILQKLTPVRSKPHSPDPKRRQVR